MKYTFLCISAKGKIYIRYYLGLFGFVDIAIYFFLYLGRLKELQPKPAVYLPNVSVCTNIFFLLFRLEETDQGQKSINKSTLITAAINTL